MRKREDGPLMRLGSSLSGGSERRVARANLHQASHYRILPEEEERAEGDPFESTPEQWVCNEQAVMLRQLADLIETIEVPLSESTIEFRTRPSVSVVLANYADDPHVVAQQEKLDEDATYMFLLRWTQLLKRHGVEHHWFDSASERWAYCGWDIPLGSVGVIKIDASGQPHVIEKVAQRIKSTEEFSERLNSRQK